MYLSVPKLASCAFEKEQQFYDPNYFTPRSSVFFFSKKEKGFSTLRIEYSFALLQVLNTFAMVKYTQPNVSQP